MGRIAQERDANMGLILGLAQTGFPADGNVLAQIRNLASRARERGVDLLVFPENLMCPHELDAAGIASIQEPLDGPFAHGVCGIAREHGLWIVFTLYRRGKRGQVPYNTAVAVDESGVVRGIYDKCHLYDAHGVRESDRFRAGEELCRPIETPLGTIGMGICYDLRFPEVARSLALAGCDLLLFPAAWHDGPNKLLHWQTLLRARAIENECFVAGVCHAGRRYVGTSFVFDPLGSTLVQGHDDLLVCAIDPKRAAKARDAMPVFDHRRPELYA